MSFHGAVTVDKEMSLDEKEYEDTTGHMAFYADDVKQFIKELKLAFPMAQEKETIDKLAGKGLK